MNYHRFFIHLAYDGTSFHGWQAQGNAITVQQYLTETLSMMLRTPVKLTGAGRTDAGVHARSFFAHFDIDRQLFPDQRQKLVYKLNGYLAPGIAIYDILPVKSDAHTRFSATARTYKYYVLRRKDPFLVNQAWFYTGPLDVPVMNEGAMLLLGKQDYTSFAKKDSDTKTNICTVSEAFWEEQEHKLIFTITADRFLRNMVRAITGTLMQLGRHKITIPEFVKIIENRDRSDAGDSVPACGLFLEDIQYPEDIWL